MLKFRLPVNDVNERLEECIDLLQKVKDDKSGKKLETYIDNCTIRDNE
jgi:hypothetical protein